jgi:hypothetical protein
MTETNDVMVADAKPYEAPEMVELGPAEVLTLGNVGCAPDGAQCKFNPTNGEAF